MDRVAYATVCRINASIFQRRTEAAGSHAQNVPFTEQNTRSNPSSQVTRVTTYTFYNVHSSINTK